ncbi:hypothetical protein EVAR_17505_1 [Eumeta japonica]|uniref:(+)RNA virus helicase C-terminal domain-containing protein n=1 Tax=Eumeta variegata TaxID=151549 RepID=A0A4C1WRF6_EUMVA|nr:hypothetical protein EVAR_17505_1 [Eumeta japonica]
MLKTVTKPKASGDAWENWMVPNITWVNGIPGRGKTSRVMNHFELGRNVMITSTREAARNLKGKLATRLGADACSVVRTMMSVLVNGLQGPKSCDRLIVYEALMSHFGAIVMATQLVDAKEVLLIGDVNQLPFINRDSERKGTCILTIHEAQGLTSDGTVIVLIATKYKIRDSVLHAVLAITLHTVICVIPHRR